MDTLRKALEKAQPYIRSLASNAAASGSAPQTNPVFALVDEIDAALSAPDRVGEIVAWRVKDFADGWILTHSKAEAEHQSREMSGATIEPLYRRFGSGDGWLRVADGPPCPVGEQADVEFCSPEGT